MSMMQWPLEALLSILLVLTLVRALRLERTLTSLRHDRAALEATISGFDANARQTEEVIDRLRVFADSTTRQVSDTVERAQTLKDDLAFLTERGDRLANQLDRLLRQGQAGLDSVAVSSWNPVNITSSPVEAPSRTEQTGLLEADGRARSKAERDLLRVLRASR